MKTFTNTITIKISDVQYETLNKLRSRNIKVSHFIREAIKEKIQREAEELKPKPKDVECPF